MVQSRAASGQFTTTKSSNKSAPEAVAVAVAGNAASHQQQQVASHTRHNSSNNTNNTNTTNTTNNTENTNTTNTTNTANTATTATTATSATAVFFPPNAKVHLASNHNHNSSVANKNLANDRDDGPPAKRRKLSIRTTNTNPNTNTITSSTLSRRHTQTTLDTFAFAQPKPPPSQLVRDEPHGRIAETINGGKSTLHVNEDELLRPSPTPDRRRTRSRSPQPAPPATISTPTPTPTPAPTPQQPAPKDDKRTLRSAGDGPRLKSELATYFPNYEDIIFDAPQEEEFLNVDTVLYVADDTAKPDTVSPAKSGKNAPNGRRVSTNDTAVPPSTPRRALPDHFNGSPSLNLDFVVKNIPDDTQDPLTDDYFLKSHKRAERKEKQLRNIEKERAMHEKGQLDKLLDGLQGHEWLRVLGITGVTEGEARKYEEKRDYFIAEVQALLDKFKQWRDQEKKQRATREAAAAAREAEEEEGDSTEGSVEPPSSDLNASAARQLQQETIIALKKSSSMASLKSKGKERAVASHPSQPATPVTAPPRLTPPPVPLEPPSPITSFYAKRHLRDAALSKTRSGRTVTAFGRDLPEMKEKEFQLPDDYVSEDVLRANARERRRRKRESTINAKEKAGS